MKKISTLRSLKDAQRFKLYVRSNTVYVLQKLNRKDSTATYTSEASGLTFTKDWGTVCYK